MGSDPADDTARGEERHDASIAPHRKANDAFVADKRERVTNAIVDRECDHVLGRERSKWSRRAKFFFDHLELPHRRFGWNSDVFDITKTIVHQCVAQFACLKQEIEMSREVTALRGNLPNRCGEATAASFARLIEEPL